MGKLIRQDYKLYIKTDIFAILITKWEFIIYLQSPAMM